MWTNSLKEQSRKGCSLKAIKIAHQNISDITVISLKEIFDFMLVCHFNMNFINDLGASIVFFFSGDARLGPGLLKYENFRSKIQSVRL
jgi:hypothetical protein